MLKRSHYWIEKRRFLLGIRFRLVTSNVGDNIIQNWNHFKMNLGKDNLKVFHNSLYMCTAGCPKKVLLCSDLYQKFFGTPSIHRLIWMRWMPNPPSPSADITILWRGSAGRRLKGLWTNLTWGKDGNIYFPYMNIFTYITNQSRQGAIKQHGKVFLVSEDLSYYIWCHPSTRPKEKCGNLLSRNIHHRNH